MELVCSLANVPLIVYEPDMEEDLVVVDDSEAEGRSQMARSSARDPRDRSPIPQERQERPVGKTPYTTTMRMRKGERGYGFSVTWTHPPR